jgi:hypothetical protein
VKAPSSNADVEAIDGLALRRRRGRRDGSLRKARRRLEGAKLARRQLGALACFELAWNML